MVTRSPISNFFILWTSTTWNCWILGISNLHSIKLLTFRKIEHTPNSGFFFYVSRTSFAFPCLNHVWEYFSSLLIARLLWLKHVYYKSKLKNRRINSKYRKLLLFFCCRNAVVWCSDWKKFRDLTIYLSLVIFPF